MLLFFLALLGAALAVAILACSLRRRTADRTGEALGLGEGSNLSAEPHPAANSESEPEES